MKRSADYNFGNHDLPYITVKGGNKKRTVGFVTNEYNMVLYDPSVSYICLTN